MPIPTTAPKWPDGTHAERTPAMTAGAATHPRKATPSRAARLTFSALRIPAGSSGLGLLRAYKGFLSPNGT
jgi:hypothetical protein